MNRFEDTPEFDYVSAFVDERFASTGFATRSLADFEFESVSRVMNDQEVMPHTVHGDLDVAEKVVLVGSKFLTPHESPHYQLLLEAYQTVLGSEYCVVGLNQYPNDGSTSLSGIKDNSVFAEDTIRLIDAMKLDGDQELIMYGYSMGGDIAIKTTHDIVNNPNRGIRPVDDLWAVEFVRTVKRGIPAIRRDNASSAADMPGEARAADVLALSEAWGAEPGEVDGRLIQAEDKQATIGAAKYFAKHPLANLLVVKSMGRTDSFDLLKKLADRPDLQTRILIGRFLGSAICNTGAFNQLASMQKIESLVAEGDHLANDNIRRAAAHMLYYASRAPMVAF